jgi:hypothetical protein
MRGFKNRTSKFGSLVSLLALSAMLVIFAGNFPVFMESVSGQVFAGMWASFSVLMIVTHAIRLTTERQRAAVILLPGKKDARTHKNIRRVQAMRG